MNAVVDASEFRQIVEATRKSLQDNTEWIQRYAKYAEEISKNISQLSAAKKNIHEWDPLKFYITIGTAKSSYRKPEFQVRYLGQRVAAILFKNGPLLKTTKELDVTNLRNFGCEISLPKVDWVSAEATKFRSFFRNREPIRVKYNNKGNDEHRVESMLLTEFSKEKSINKALKYIKPVKIEKLRFSMLTPVKASDHKLEPFYSSQSGGGIDIFTRVGNGRSSNLCIMELKDENKRGEPPKLAIQQALIYATFIRELLRSDSGQIWWKLFGYSKKIPSNLELFAACVMPSNQYDDKSFAGMEIPIENDKITLHYLYFQEENNKITQIETSLNNK